MLAYNVVAFSSSPNSSVDDLETIEASLPSRWEPDEIPPRALLSRFGDVTRLAPRLVAKSSRNLVCVCLVSIGAVAVLTIL